MNTSWEERMVTLEETILKAIKSVPDSNTPFLREKYLFYNKVKKKITILRDQPKRIKITSIE